MMSRHRRVLPAFLLAAVMQSSTAQFQGVVESKNMTTDELGSQQQFTMTMWITKDMVRIQNSAMGSTPVSTMIYRNDRHVVWMVNDEDRSYFEIVQENQLQKPEDQQSPVEDEKAVIRKTGRKKSILGYKCEQFFIKRADAETEIWGTKGLSSLAASLSQALGEQQGEPLTGLADELTRMGVFPLLAYTRLGKNIVESQEVTRIRSQAMQQDLFEIPAGYKRLKPGEVK